MDEFKFVVKCFIFACLLMVLSQLKTEGITLEARLQHFLVSSTVANFVNQSAQGGVKLIEELSVKTKKTIETWRGTTSSIETSRFPNNNNIDQEIIDHPAIDRE